jgi:hypothetical protein
MKTGLTIGRYRVEDLIGAGAMGEVYCAYDRVIDRPVAIKSCGPADGGPRRHAVAAALPEGNARFDNSDSCASFAIWDAFTPISRRFPYPVLECAGESSDPEEAPAAAADVSSSAGLERRTSRRRLRTGWLAKP